MFACLIGTTIAPLMPLNLETLSLHQARALAGRPVVVTFIVGKPAQRWGSSTITGTYDTPDGVERAAILRGRRFDVKEGRRTALSGTLLVIDHPARRIGKEVVLPWSEIRIEEGQPISRCSLPGQPG